MLCSSVSTSKSTPWSSHTSIGTMECSACAKQQLSIRLLLLSRQLLLAYKSTGGLAMHTSCNLQTYSSSRSHGAIYYLSLSSRRVLLLGVQELPYPCPLGEYYALRLLHAGDVRTEHSHWLSLSLAQTRVPATTSLRGYTGPSPGVGLKRIVMEEGYHHRPTTNDRDVAVLFLTSPTRLLCIALAGPRA